MIVFSFIDVLVIMMLTGFCREKVNTKRDSDFGGIPTLISFSRNGKVLCVAGRDGLLCMLNIEDDVITNAYVLPISNMQTDIISVSWHPQKLPGGYESCISGNDFLISSKWGPAEISETEVDYSRGSTPTSFSTSPALRYLQLFQENNMKSCFCFSFLYIYDPFSSNLTEIGF